MVVNPLQTFIFEQVIGLYLIIMAIIMLARANYYRNVIRDLTADKTLILVSASLFLVLGLIVVVLHNLWDFKFNVIVTIVGWLIVIKAVLLLAFPEYMIQLSKKLYKGNYYYFMAIFEAIIGLLLLVHSYYFFS